MHSGLNRDPSGGLWCFAGTAAKKGRGTALSVSIVGPLLAYPPHRRQRFLRRFHRCRQRNQPMLLSKLRRLRPLSQRPPLCTRSHSMLSRICMPAPRPYRERRRGLAGFSLSWGACWDWAWWLSSCWASPWGRSGSPGAQRRSTRRRCFKQIPSAPGNIPAPACPP